MSQRLAEADADRALMLAGISHDMRTPLARLRLALAMLPEGDAELEGSVSRQVDSIERMLGQFLDYARGVEGPIGPVDLAELAREVCAGEAADQPIALEAPAPCRMIGHVDSLRRALQNLIVNARRHGTPPVRVWVSQAAGRVTIGVGDAGPGIDPAEASRLVRPFTRGDEARGGGGTGLGLAIVDRIARAHRGALRLSRPEGGGFEAIIDLPAA